MRTALFILLVAVAAGLTCRSVAETVRDTLAWSSARTSVPATQMAVGSGARPGLTPEREAQLFAAWAKR